MTDSDLRIAERFTELAEALDVVMQTPVSELTYKSWPIACSLLEEGTITSLDGLLRYWLLNEVRMNGSVVVSYPVTVQRRYTSLGNEHYTVLHKGEFRRQLPKEVLKGLGRAGYHQATRKINPRWIVAYLDGNLPTEAHGWEYFECSHKCVESGLDRFTNMRNEAKGYTYSACVDARCLTWESKSANQGRQNPGCRRMCHCGCGQSICEANGLHEESCR